MRKLLKWVGVTLGGLIALILIIAVSLFLVGRSKLNRTYAATNLLTAAAPADPAAITRGQRIAYTRGCFGCHGDNLGGKLFLDIPPGKIVASNLTAGRSGIGGSYSDQDWDRAIRHGLRPSGKMILPFMPSRLFSRLSDEDTAALIAYLKSLPKVDSNLPATEVRLPGYFMMALADTDELRGGPATPHTTSSPGPTAAYGAYIASTTCVECHGDRLQGGKHPAPSAPPGPELSHAGRWSLEEFDHALRGGVVPGGRKLSEWMPSDAFSHFTDEEVQALHAYLKSLTPAVAAK